MNSPGAALSALGSRVTTQRQGAESSQVQRGGQGSVLWSALLTPALQRGCSIGSPLRPAPAFQSRLPAGPLHGSRPGFPTQRSMQWTPSTSSEEQEGKFRALEPPSWKMVLVLLPLLWRRKSCVGWPLFWAGGHVGVAWTWVLWKMQNQPVTKQPYGLGQSNFPSLSLFLHLSI